MNITNFRSIVLFTLVIAGVASCKKDFNTLPGTELDVSQMYRNVNDANSAVIGIYGKFMSLSDRYIILNELRGDLMEYTQNADQYLRQISTHSVSPDNPYINPRPFYELIINCNDVLKNFDIMREKKALKEDEYNERYSDIACLRSFLYLQLGIHYGQVPYITEPLENITDLSDLNRFPKLNFDELLDALIEFTDKIPFKEPYPPNVGNDVGASLNIFLDGYSTSKFFINKYCLLGDLHLWKGNYTKAATYYREVMETEKTGSGENYYSLYRIGWSGNANLYVDYSRDGDISTLLITDGWGSMFQASDERFNREMIWTLPYDSRFKPENPLIPLFSPLGGNYLVQPSQEILDSWNNQEQIAYNQAGALNGTPYDARGLLSVRSIGGKPVIMKFISNYINPVTLTPINALTKNGKWFLYRAAHLHLRFAEAANRDRLPRLAYALLNNGIPDVFNNTALADKTTTMNTFAYPDPYKFDARNGEIPRFRSAWYRNTGIRERANLKNMVLPSTNSTDSISKIEIALLDEAALETAFEGNRWPDLLRISLRRNDPSIIANRVYDKLRKDGVGNAAEVRAKLMARNWYLPFKLE